MTGSNTAIRTNGGMDSVAGDFDLFHRDAGFEVNIVGADPVAQLLEFTNVANVAHEIAIIYDKV